MPSPTNILNINTEVVTLGIDDLVYDFITPSIVVGCIVDFDNTVTIGKNIVGATTSIPLVDLTAHSSSIPLIRSIADVANALVLENIDNSDVTNSYLDSTGRFFSRRVTADSFAVTTHEQSVGAVTLGFTGASLFACDASGGPITYTLPTLDSNSPSGYQFTFKKTDVSVNTVMVSASGGQGIDGATNTYLTSRWGLLKVVSIVSGGSGYWLIIDTSGTTGPKGDTGTGATGSKGDTGTDTKGDTGTHGDTGA